MSPTRKVHDLGGRLGYGPVPYEPNEPPFHHTWEQRVFGMLFEILPITAIRPGETRYALERLAPEDYFDHGGYYGRWEARCELLLEEYGHLAPGELDRRLGAPVGTGPASRASPVVSKNPALLPADRPTPQPDLPTVIRELDNPPSFAIGDEVVARPAPQAGHTRLPGYVAGTTGSVVAIHPAEVLPDSTAHDLGERAQHVYCVGYNAADLWGSEAETGVTIHVDIYENYLSSTKKYP